MRHITPAGLQLIMRHEGFSPTPYICPARVKTIGYGHVIEAGENFPAAISEKEAQMILQRDVGAAEHAVLRLIAVPLTNGQFDALVSFTFNLGSGALQRSILRRKVNRGEHEEVPQELMKWVWAAGRKLPGLIRRRAEESFIYSML